MLRLSKLDDRIVAVLHDVLEDTVVTKDDLIEAGASKEIITALELVTKGDIPYEYYLHCIGMNDIARNVKRADIADNTDPERLDKLPNDVKERLIEKYSKALRILDKTEKLLQLTLKASDVGVIDLEPDYKLGIEKQLDRDLKILEGFLGGTKS